MKTENWVNGMTVYFYGNDIDKWKKICKDAEEGKVPAITLRGVKYDLVRHGKLLRTDAYPHRLYCSECFRTLIPNEEICFEKNEFPKWCMWCGAKMDEVNE